MKFSKRNTRMPSLASRCPMAAAASFTDDCNVSELARLMGKNPKTLLAKLSNDVDTHQLTLAEAVAITDITEDERILKAWANGNGRIVFSMPTGGLTDEEFSDLLLANQQRSGALASSILAARSDGVITEDDYATIHKKILASVEGLLQLDKEIKHQVRDWGEDTYE